MKLVLSGTNRPGSNSLKVAQLIADLYKENGESVDILDLQKIPLEHPIQKYSAPHKSEIQSAIDKIQRAEGIVVVVPEYNGSYPGILKYFIDHWTYPDSFEYRPVCFVGLGGRFGGLRPVEHLQQVFGYRNAYICPFRVFIFNVWEKMKNGEFQDPATLGLLKEQVTKFKSFVRALQTEGLDANSVQQKMGASR